MSKHRYQEAGQYIAVCNKTNWNGHYIEVFEYPQKFIDDYKESIKGDPDRVVPDACWYFLNRVNFIACVEAVYPLEIFKKLKELL